MKAVPSRLSSQASDRTTAMRPPGFRNPAARISKRHCGSVNREHPAASGSRSTADRNTSASVCRGAARLPTSASTAGGEAPNGLPVRRSGRSADRPPSRKAWRRVAAASGPESMPCSWWAMRSSEAPSARRRRTHSGRKAPAPGSGSRTTSAAERNAHRTRFAATAGGAGTMSRGFRALRIEVEAPGRGRKLSGGSQNATRQANGTTKRSRVLRNRSGNR